MYPHRCEAGEMRTVAKEKIGTQIDVALDQRLTTPVGNFVTFEQMHAEYERRHGMKIDVAAEAAKLAHRSKPKRS
jgi:hypothetical protein